MSVHRFLVYFSYVPTPNTLRYALVVFLISRPHIPPFGRVTSDVITASYCNGFHYDYHLSSFFFFPFTGECQNIDATYADLNRTVTEYTIHYQKYGLNHSLNICFFRIPDFCRLTLITYYRKEHEDVLFPQPWCKCWGKMCYVANPSPLPSAFRNAQYCTKQHP